MQREKDKTYERNYRLQKEQEVSKLKKYQAISSDAKNDEARYFSLIREYYKSVPKHVVESDQKNYEYLLEFCDMLAKQFGGHIQGAIKEGDCAKIHLTLPFIEFCTEEDLQFLKKISVMAKNVTFEPADNNMVRMSLRIDYFKEDVEFEDYFAEKVKNFMEREEIPLEEAAKMIDMDMELLKEILGF